MPKSGLAKESERGTGGRGEYSPATIRKNIEVVNTLNGFWQ
jgi:hypothetical protein